MDGQSQVPAHKPGNACPNCGAEGVDIYCSKCGQRRPGADDYALRHFVVDAAEEYFSVEGKILRTLGALVRRPGQLTLDHVNGRRQMYVKPFALFLTVNVVFLILAVTQGIYDFTLYEYLKYAPPSPELVEDYVRAAMQRSGMTYEAYESAFNANSNTLRKGLIILLVPCFAIVAWILNFRRRPYFVQHVVFAIHFFAFYWLYVALFAPPLAALVENLGYWADPIVFYTNMTVASVYLFLAHRRNYRQHVLATLPKVAALMFTVYLLLRSYRVLLFFGAYALT